MKHFWIVLILILVLTGTLTVFLSNCMAQDYTQMGLPEGAKGRLAKGAIYGIEYSPDGKHLAVNSSIGVWIYDAQGGKKLSLFTRSTSGSRINDNMSFSPDGQTIASGGSDRTIRLWDVATGTLKQTFIGHTDNVTSTSFSPDGQTIASGSSDETIRLWDVSTGAFKQILIGSHTHVLSISFSPDGKTIVSASGSHISLWDVKTGARKDTFWGHSWGVHSVLFSPDGQTIASTGVTPTFGGFLRLWDVTGNRKHSFSFAGNGISFSPDGKTLASGVMTEKSIF